MCKVSTVNLILHEVKLFGGFLYHWNQMYGYGFYEYNFPPQWRGPTTMKLFDQNYTKVFIICFVTGKIKAYIIKFIGSGIPFHHEFSCFKSLLSVWNELSFLRCQFYNEKFKMFQFAFITSNNLIKVMPINHFISSKHGHLNEQKPG